jgi:hypothetical protein
MGSLTGRLAFMAKAVWGRFRVDFKGLVSAIALVVSGFVSVTSGIYSSGFRWHGCQISIVSGPHPVRWQIRSKDMKIEK